MIIICLVIIEWRKPCMRKQWCVYHQCSVGKSPNTVFPCTTRLPAHQRLRFQLRPKAHVRKRSSRKTSRSRKWLGACLTMPVGRDRARELFKAAKTGDVNAIERLLGTRKKGSGRWVSFERIREHGSVVDVVQGRCLTTSRLAWRVRSSPYVPQYCHACACVLSYSTLC